MDALDQIGDTVIESVKEEYFGESHNRGIVERLTKEVKILDVERTENGFPPSPARPWYLPARWRR